MRAEEIDWVKFFGEDPLHSSKAAPDLLHSVKNSGGFYIDGVLEDYLANTKCSLGQMTVFLDDLGFEEHDAGGITKTIATEEFKWWLRQLDTCYRENRQTRQILINYTSQMLMFSSGFHLKRTDLFEFFNLVRKFDLVSDNFSFDFLLSYGEETCEIIESLCANEERVTNEDFVSMYCFASRNGFAGTKEYVKHFVKEFLNPDDVLENTIRLYEKNQRGLPNSSNDSKMYLIPGLELIRSLWSDKIEDSVNTVLGKLELNAGQKQEIYSKFANKHIAEDAFNYSNN